MVIEDIATGTGKTEERLFGTVGLNGDEGCP